VDVANKLLWVNRGVNLAPTSGQASPYTLYQYDADGQMSRQERKYAVGGTVQTYDFLWDGDDRLHQVKQGVSSRFSFQQEMPSRRRVEAVSPRPLPARRAPRSARCS
jgi:hypothetical protein